MLDQQVRDSWIHDSMKRISFQCQRQFPLLQILLGWHQDIMTITQRPGILTFCNIVCVVIPDLLCVQTSECWNICQEIMQRTLDHAPVPALASSYQSNLNPAPGDASVLRCMGKSQF